MIVSYKTELLMADGSFETAGNLAGKTFQGWSYGHHGHFVQETVHVEPVGVQRLYRFKTKSGRVIDVGDKDTAVYSGDGWLNVMDIPHTARQVGAKMHNVELEIAELGYFPHAGTLHKDNNWLRVAANNLFPPGLAEDIPSYFGKLDHDSLLRLLHIFYYDPNATSFRLANSFARDRLFHLLTRIGVHAVGLPSHLTLLKAKMPPTNLPLHSGKIHEFSKATTVPALELKTEHGNILEKNTIWQTKQLT